MQAISRILGCPDDHCYTDYQIIKRAFHVCAGEVPFELKVWFGAAQKGSGVNDNT